jgi:archaea-specific DNA-binding protein
VTFAAAGNLSANGPARRALRNPSWDKLFYTVAMAGPMADRTPEGHGPAGATVFIGTKPTMTYVFQVVAQLNSGAGPVVVKARGNAIGKAVDVAEVVRHRFLEGQVDVGPVTINTERLVNRDGREANVSSIAIALTRTTPIPPRPEPSPTPPA